MSLTAFVTGATGFVGSNLVKTLLDQGWAVTVVARKDSSRQDIEDLPIDIRFGDIVDLPSLRESMPDRVDAVFHVAASTNVWAGNNDEQDRVNIGGTRNVVECAIEARAGRLLLTSSFTTWGFQDQVINELSPRSLDSDWINYVRTKRISENIVKDAVQAGALDAVILNPGHILGPGDRNNWSRMIRMVSENALPGVPPGGGDFADVREVAKAHVAAFHKGEPGAHYLLGGEDVSFAEVIRLVAEILGKEVPTRITPAWLLRTLAHGKAVIAAFTRRPPDITPESAKMICHHVRCDSSHAMTALGYRHTPIRQLLQDTVDWMRGEGLLR